MTTRVHAPRPAHRRPMVCPSLFAWFGCLALCLAAARPAAGAFVNGVETFDGTTKDPATWDEYNQFDNAITQNDAINFRFVLPPSPATGSVRADYTARTAPVGVGQGASVDVRVNTASAPISVWFHLTDNTDGPDQSVFLDDNFIDLHLNQQVPNTAFIGRGGNGSVSGVGTSIFPVPVPLTPGAQYTLQIERPALNTARFSVFNTATGARLGTATANVTGLPTTLYPAFGITAISIPRTTDYSIDFDNVRVIPEPGSAAVLFGLPALFLRRWRRAA